jgi:hypothetical protein
VLRQCHGFPPFPLSPGIRNAQRYLPGNWSAIDGSTRCCLPVYIGSKHHDR